MSKEKFLKLMGLSALLLGDLGVHATGGNDRNEGLKGAPPKDPSPIIPKGHHKFLIEGVEVYALNQKNAEKKFKKLGR